MELSFPPIPERTGGWEGQHICNTTAIAERCPTEKRKLLMSSLDYLSQDRFSIKCLKTKVITTTNQCKGNITITQRELKAEPCLFVGLSLSLTFISSWRRVVICGFRRVEGCAKCSQTCPLCMLSLCQYNEMLSLDSLPSQLFASKT